jgi:hypothetical protein
MCGHGQNSRQDTCNAVGKRGCAEKQNGNRKRRRFAKGCATKDKNGSDYRYHSEHIQGATQRNHAGLTYQVNRRAGRLPARTQLRTGAFG